MFFTEDKFFKGLRFVLALDQRNVALGEVVIQVINEDIIPELQTRKAREPDEGKQEELQKEIDIWKKYGNKSKKEGRSWNVEAVKVIGNLGNAWGLTEQDKEEMAQQITSNFYTRPKLRNSLDFSRPDRKGGPIGLLQLFKHVIGQEARSYRDREIRKRQKEIQLQTEGVDILRTIKENRPSELDRKLIREVKRDMQKYVEKRLPKEEQKSLFNRWIELAEDKGPDKVNISKDIFPEWTVETGKSTSSGDAYFKKIKNLIVKYLREEQDIHLNKAQLKKLKVSHSVADRFIRQKIASWILELVNARRNQFAQL
jgi:hypothetical protein